MSSSPAVADAPPSELERVVNSFRAILDNYPSVPRMEKLDGQIRWEHWGVSMGSNRSSHSSFRTVAKPAKKCLVREFQEELYDYLFRRGTSRAAEKRSLDELFPVMKAAQASWREDRADAADDESDYSDDE